MSSHATVTGKEVADYICERLSINRDLGVIGKSVALRSARIDRIRTVRGTLQVVGFVLRIVGNPQRQRRLSRQHLLLTWRADPILTPVLVRQSGDLGKSA